ncbi:hypothetical protein [Novosphingobium olei]|uniref:Uncharacterized protein n=1 Tax=Novosphingobium olei TaxID=2728851 RepID=A0A7Y0BSY0_9SPHN|nr:hypothetical protein [Novosphingobium olei]NML95883.1 hypothetical protein [Novosphingobium olei]
MVAKTHVRLVVVATAIAGQSSSAQANLQSFCNAMTFRGVRIEANAGDNRFQSEGNHHDKFRDSKTTSATVIIAEGSH